MTTEEKLKHFLDITLKNANEKSEKSLTEYQKGLDQMFESYKEDELRKQSLKLKLSEENMEKEKNTEVAEQQVKLRRSLNDKQEKLRDMLFQGVQQRLEEYRKTDTYLDYLKAHIKKAMAFSQGEESEHGLEIYLDPGDADKKTDLEEAMGVAIRISEYPFGGGVRAVIRSRNMLMDQSFDSGVEEARNEFKFYF